MEILYPLWAAFLTTVVWFIAGGVVYMNPFVAKIYKGYETHPSMKKWKNQKHYLLSVFFVAGFIPIIFIAYAYRFMIPIGVLEFGLLLSGIRIVPRMMDMWVQSTYPDKILLIELVNGCILSFVIAYSLSLLM